MSYLPTTNMCPLKLAVKYNPPTIAVFYKNNLRDRKKRRFAFKYNRYNIFLNQLAFLPTAQEITERLFDEHTQFLNFVDFDQVYKMVQLLMKNFQSSQQNNPLPGQNYINQIGEANSYIESDNDLNKSIVFENEEEVYYTSYQPTQERQKMKPLPFQDNQSFVNEVPLRSRYVNQQSPSDNQKISNFSSHLPSENTPQAQAQDVWTTGPSKKVDNLSLSISGMQQFMESHNPSNNKMPFYPRSSIRSAHQMNQRSNSNSPINMPQINNNATNQSMDSQSRIQPLISIRQDENNFNIANFVEEGAVSNQNMYITDQTYASPAPQKRNNKFVQQQINQNQKYYLQQQSLSPGKQDKKNKSKVNFLKQIQDLRGDSYQDFFD